MDDGIINSWCFNYVECLDSTPFAAIIVMVENLESFLSLRSQQQNDILSIFIYVNDII